MSKTFVNTIKKAFLNDKNFDVSFPRRFFVLSRFRVLFGDGSSKTPPKTFHKQNLVEKFTKEIDQKSNTDLFSGFLYRVFGRFSVRGVQKHENKYRKNKSDPGLFSASGPPTHHWGSGLHSLWSSGVDMSGLNPAGRGIPRTTCGSGER
jgi:hypothetical protein